MVVALFLARSVVCSSLTYTVINLRILADPPLVVSREVALRGGNNFSEEMLTILPFPFASFSIPTSSSYSHPPDKSIPSLQSPGGNQMQSQIDACVQANITETSLMEPTDSLHLDPDGTYHTMIRPKTSASTLPSAGNSSMNPMSLDYRTRTLR